MQSVYTTRHHQKAKRKAIRFANEAAEKATTCLWIKRAELRTNTAGTQVTWARVYDAERPETLNDPGFITDDVSRGGGSAGSPGQGCMM